jgi:hypothetical protein
LQIGEGIQKKAFSKIAFPEAFVNQKTSPWWLGVQNLPLQLVFIGALFLSLILGSNATPVIGNACGRLGKMGRKKLCDS